MADEDKKENETSEDVSAETSDDAPAKKKLAGKTLVIFFVLPALFILGGGIAVGMMLGGGGKKDVQIAEVSDEKAAYDDHAKEDDHKEDDHGKDDKAKDDKAKDDGKEKKDAKGDGYGKDDGEPAKGPKRETGTLQVGGAGDPSYYLMPDLLVNLSSTAGDRQMFLKLKLTLEAENPDMFNEIPKVLPRITDQLQMFLRELRVDDLNGSAGGFILRQELLHRINIAISPSRVDAVLIEEMLIQ